MSAKSPIEWTERTWNPVVGCSIVSPGCTNCYAMRMAQRLQKMNVTGGSNSNYVNHYDGTTRSTKCGPVWTGKVARAPDKLFLKPLGWKKPSTIFVNSMGDLFHESIPDEWIDCIFAVMALCPQHTFQVLTKRAARMHQYFDGRKTAFGRCSLRLADIEAPWLPEELIQDAADWLDLTDIGGRPLPNVWLGVSCERQQEADERVPLLLRTPAAVRFVSAEPLLGPVIFHPLGCGTNALSSSTGPNLDWIIVGGESGADARPMHPQWVRNLRDQSIDADVKFFFKQWGEWAPGERADEPDLYRVGKKAAGRLLDGRQWNGMPAGAVEARAAAFRDAGSTS
jgi:protein gp37